MPQAHSKVTLDAEAAIAKLLAYCQASDWAGYDPYDALNSRLFDKLPFLNYSLPRIAMTQVLKNSPVNIRSLTLVPKKQNPKAISLFLSGILNLSKDQTVNRQGLIESMIERLIALRSPGDAYWCWGYSFPWQTRHELVPAGAANLVCTTFVASALLDAYEQCQDSRCLNMAVSAAEYIRNELFWTDGTTVAGFSYPQPGVRSTTHNANLLSAALLCRVHKHTGDARFLGPALQVARYSAGRQHRDGSWAYGELPTQQCNDNFHTGYNLCALQSIGRYAETTEFETCVRRGFDFYRDHFLLQDGSVRYFHDRTYPIDIHCVAQSIITLLALKEFDTDNAARAGSVFRWAMNHMWDDRGFFYYRKLRFFTVKTSYMRWSQAWMFLALSMLVSESNSASNRPQPEDSAAVPQPC
jgi:hypothetical protein